MTQDKTKEYSVIMAEFMGYKLVNIHSPFLGKVWRKDDLNNSPLYKLMEGNEQDNIYFHKSYDWLMPVYFKFRDLKSNENLDLFFYCQVLVNIEKALLNSLIEEAFEELAIGIIWFNNSIKK